MTLPPFLSLLFSTCKENKGIYSALRLDKVFNISTFLNTTVVSLFFISLLCSSSCSAEQQLPADSSRSVVTIIFTKPIIPLCDLKAGT